MDQATIDRTSAQKAKRTASKPPLRTAVKKTEPKKVRADGTVKTTLLLDAWIDEQLSALAFAWKTDRSELARQFIAAKLMTYNVAEELGRAAAAYARRQDRVEPDDSNDRQSESDGVKAAA
jgi:hypothetical protein